MLQQRLAELEQLAMLNKEPKDITKKVSKMKQRLEAELAAVPDAHVTQLRSKADAFARELTEMCDYQPRFCFAISAAEALCIRFRLVIYLAGTNLRCACNALQIRLKPPSRKPLTRCRRKRC
jgi:hypothetical protein